MASSTQDGDAHDSEIRLWREGEWWIATDVETGVTTQGKSRVAVLENLDDAVTVHTGERENFPTDEGCRKMGTDPAGNTTSERPRMSSRRSASGSIGTPDVGKLLLLYSRAGPYWAGNERTASSPFGGYTLTLSGD